MLYPSMCGHKIRKVMSYKAMDAYDPETGTITPGTEMMLWQTCGRKPGHDGEHGPGSRLSLLRLRFANWLEDVRS